MIVEEPNWNFFKLDEDILEEVKKIWKRAKVNTEAFYKGYNYAYLLTEGHKRTDAYREAYNVDAEKARSNATNQFRAVWIQRLMELLKIPDDNRFLSIKLKNIAKLQTVIDTSDDPKTIMDAIRIQAQLIKEDKKPKMLEEETKEEQKEDEAATAFKQMVEAMKITSNAGKVIQARGDLIDVSTIN